MTVLIVNLTSVNQVDSLPSTSRTVRFKSIPPHSQSLSDGRQNRRLLLAVPHVAVTPDQVCSKSEYVPKDRRQYRNHRHRLVGSRSRLSKAIYSRTESAE